MCTYVYTKFYKVHHYSYYTYTGYPEAAVRLIEATSPREGFIIIHHRGSWGAVCNDDAQFNIVDATVVCRQLGYSSAITIEHGEWDPFQALLVPEYFYYNLECTGAESDLMECHHIGTPSACIPNQPAGVKCSGELANKSMLTVHCLRVIEHLT